jgi:hypothetical protein
MKVINTKKVGNFRNIQINLFSCVLPVLLCKWLEEEEEEEGWKRNSLRHFQVNATWWPQGDSSFHPSKESSYIAKGLILNSRNTSNTGIKIEAPEGFSENKMKGESPRGNPEFAAEAK